GATAERSFCSKVFDVLPSTSSFDRQFDRLQANSISTIGIDTFVLAQISNILLGEHAHFRRDRSSLQIKGKGRLMTTFIFKAANRFHPALFVTLNVELLATGFRLHHKL